jgi:hypothetical protein
VADSGVVPHVESGAREKSPEPTRGQVGGENRCRSEAGESLRHGLVRGPLREQERGVADEEADELREPGRRPVLARGPAAGVDGEEAPREPVEKGEDRPIVLCSRTKQGRLHRWHAAQRERRGLESPGRVEVGAESRGVQGQNPGNERAQATRQGLVGGIGQGGVVGAQALRHSP